MLSLNIPPQNYSDDLEGRSYRQVVIGSFITTTRPFMHHVLHRDFLRNIKSPRWLSPDLASCYFCLFSKLKSPLKGKIFQTISEIQENTVRQLMAIGRTVWSPKVLTVKGTEASLSYVQLSLVSCIFFNKCLFFIVHGWVPSGQSSYIIFIIKIFASENLKEQFKISGNWNNSKKWETKLSNNI